MKTVIFLHNEGLVEELGWKRQAQAFPLIPVGGDTIIGHILDLFATYLGDEVAIISPNMDAETGMKLSAQYPGIFMTFAMNWRIPSLFDGEVMVINGRYLTNPNLPSTLPATAAITDEKGNVTALWMKNGRLPSTNFEKWMNAMGEKATAYPAHFSFPVRTIAELQHANTRLLGLGYGSEDLVARSYAEEFMGLPPVFLHETAVVTHSIIGPYAHISADAHIKSSIIRNSIISAGAHIENCILDGVIIDANSKISSKLRVTSSK